MVCLGAKPKLRGIHFGEIALLSGSGAGKIAHTPRLGGFGVEAPRLSPSVVGRMFNVTEPPGIGRA